MVLESLRFSRVGGLEVLDQLLVPTEKKYIPVKGSEDAWRVVRSMQVRGAPLLAMVSALGLAVEALERAEKGSEKEAPGALQWLKERMTYLKTSRPTAVNLFNTMDALQEVVEHAAASGSSDKQIYYRYVEAAERMLEEDVQANKAIADAGADAILAAMKAKGREGQARVMTICNTGALATAGWGTALGVLRTLHARGRLERAFCLETRPYNQGARLTAFELVEDGLPGTLICDSMAAALMQCFGVDACVVGADRVVANGDTANKIGTYSLAVLSRHHGVPFYVAAPLTTLDVKLKDGSEIPIEERPDEELCSLKLDGKSFRIAAPGIGVWNPAFDVTPASLISGLVTDHGLIPKRSQDFDVTSFVSNKKRKTKS
ncbi:Methylthioribose-1-phosphate isomerase (M1Pi) (MTR-1-P isomerase) (S-methyl-5-thioribose-1-phosphate isomerase) (Translation initiation factor eIF-2B subunit alpha/beta/delta-like protein) [Durusdinium trenchii]|uniref:Methylthioribose-1-phosphate isomerase n=1 Tax=Durusdinium trenchii TaxID=1381693 RepID=A0ABP0ICJ3_9DINO